MNGQRKEKKNYRALERMEERIVRTRVVDTAIRRGQILIDGGGAIWKNNPHGFVGDPKHWFTYSIKQFALPGQFVKKIYV